MRTSWLVCLCFGSWLFAGTQDADLNVNKRYTVDSVIVAGKGWTTNVADTQSDKLSTPLRRDLAALIGQKLNPAILDELAARIKKEFSAREVYHHLLRGEVPDHVQVQFDIKPVRGNIDATVTKFVYDSNQGWNGAGALGFTVRQNTLLFGLASDGDTLNERFAGISASYQNSHVGTDSVGLRFLFESYHEQWNRNTLDGLSALPRQTSDAYRTRQNFQPTARIALAKPLTLEVGLAFERFQDQYPAAHFEGANAFITTLRYHERATDTAFPQELDVAYTLRTSSKVLQSDYVYTAHSGGLHYHMAHGKHQLLESADFGAIGGRAPLSDRFVAGNTYFLRGWNKDEIDPIGGNRMAVNSVEYRYGPLQAFYDAGAVWDSGQTATVRHSVGIGLKESIFSLAVAFPMRAGHIEPIIMMGMIY
jgi:hypothetical protein